MVKQQTNRMSTGVVVGIVAAMVATGGGAAWWTMHFASSSTNLSPPTTTASQSSTSSSESQTTPSQVQTIKIYWLKDTDKHLELVQSSVKLRTANQPNIILATAFNRLLAGPTEAGVSSTIPQGTKLRDVKIKSDGIHINLSQEFTSGGGSDSMIGRIGQVLYTATSLEPSAKVWISVEGNSLTTLGGEGIEIDQPLTRQNFQRSFSL